MSKLRNFIVALAAPLALLTPATAETAAKSAPKISAAQVKAAVAASRGVFNVTPCACLKPYVDWCKKTDGNTFYYLGYALTSNNQAGVVTFSEGALVLDAAKGVLDTTYWSPDVPLYFDNRVWGSNSWGLGGHPFDPNHTDKIVLTISPVACTLRITPKAPAGAAITVSLQCQNSVLSGWGPAPNANLYTLSLQTLKQDIPK